MSDEYGASAAAAEDVASAQAGVAAQDAGLPGQEEVNPLLDAQEQRARLGEIKAQASKMPATALYGMVHLAHGYIDEHGQRHNTVMLKQMTARHTSALVTGDKFDRDRLAHVLWDCCESFGSYTKDTDGKKLREILDQHLLLTERFQLIIMLRQLALGPDFNYTAICPNPDCQHRDEYTVALPDLEVIGKVEGDPNKQVMLWEDMVGQPWKVEWRFSTAGDDQWFDQLMRAWRTNYAKIPAKKREQEYDPADLDVMSSLFLTRAYAVTGPDGVRHILRPLRFVERGEDDKVVPDLIQFVLNLPQDLVSDFAYLVDDLEPSLDVKVEFSCNRCGGDMRTLLLVGSAAFFSRSSRSQRAKRA